MKRKQKIAAAHNRKHDFIGMHVDIRCVCVCFFIIDGADDMHQNVLKVLFQMKLLNECKQKIARISVNKVFHKLVKKNALEEQRTKLQMN